MKPSADIFDFNENGHIKKLQKKRIFSFICVFLIIAIVFGIYFTYQYLFIKKLEKYISAYAKQPENVLPSAFLKYKSFFAKQPNITGISFKTILKRHFRMDLPPVNEPKAEILKKLHDELIPEKFPVSIEEFQIRKENEAQKLYPLAKLGDKVKIQSVRGNYTGIFNGTGSKGASVRIDQKIFSVHDLSRESKALFDSGLNPIVQREYVIRECNRYKRKIERFSLSVMTEELRKRGYFYHGKFYSPQEYLTAMENNNFPHQSHKEQIVYEEAREPKLLKLPKKSSKKYFSEPLPFESKSKQKQHF